MKASKFIRFLRNGLFLLLVASLVLILSCAGYAQEEVKAIRQSGNSTYIIDPAVGSDNVSSIAFVNLYDALVFPTPEGSVKPWLAKSWEMSEDGLTYTFDLVPGVKFHNGDELTADDVVFSMERIMTIGEGYGYLFITSVGSVKALEKYRVQFTLKDTFGPFLGTLVNFYILNRKQVMANIQKKGSYGELGDYGKDWLINHDAGSGPYKVKENKAPEYLLLEKFDDFWAGWENKDAPQYWKQFGTREAITVKTLFSRGEMEITDQYQNSETLAAIDQFPNTEVAALYVGSIMNLMLNNKRSPTDDIHFRKALAYCVDYQQIIDKIFPGSRRSGPVAQSTPGYHPNLKLYTLDLAKAEEEIKQSPYYGNLDQYPIEIHWSDSIPDMEKVVLMIQSNAANLGIKVESVKSPWTSMIANMATMETTPHGSIIAVPPHYAEAGSVLMARYHSSSCGTWEQGEWLKNPEIDSLIDDLLTTNDEKERFQKGYVLQEKIMELSPSIWLMEQAIKQAYRTDYVVFPAAEAAKQGKPAIPVKNYNFYFRDFKVTPETALEPYTPFNL